MDKQTIEQLLDELTDLMSKQKDLDNHLDILLNKFSRQAKIQERESDRVWAGLLNQGNP